MENGIINKHIPCFVFLCECQPVFLCACFLWQVSCAVLRGGGFDGADMFPLECHRALQL